MYVVDMKSFPLTEEGLQALVAAPEDESISKNWDGPYIEGGKLPRSSFRGARNRIEMREAHVEGRLL